MAGGMGGGSGGGMGGGSGGGMGSGSGGGMGNGGDGGMGGGSGGGMGGMGGMGGGGMMGHGSLTHMTFFWGEHAEILFTNWPGNRGIHVYFLVLFLVALTAFVCECLSFATRRLASPASASTSVRAASGLALTAVHAVKMGLLYLVMLAVMSFNGGVLIAAVAGHAIGFLVVSSGMFRWAPAGGADKV